MKPTGLPRKVIAVYADGRTKIYDSVTECSRCEGVTPQYICRICRNPDKPFQSATYHPTRFRYTEQTNTNKTMAEYNDYAYIACAREYVYNIKTNGKSGKSDLCNKYHISHRFTPYMDKIAQIENVTDEQIIAFKLEMQEACNAKDALRRKEPQGAEDFAKLINLLRSIDAKLETLINK